MDNITVYRLCARDGPLVFHLGERGVGLEESSLVLHSDTLFSAICLAWRSLGYRLGDLLAAFPGAMPESGGQGAAPITPPFLLSSAFPYCGEIYFLPRPLLPMEGINDDPAIGKTLKKIRFVSQTLFEKFIARQPVGDYLLQDGPGGKQLRRDLILQSSTAWLADSDLTSSLPENRVIWKDVTQPRVAISRAGSRSTPFGAGRVQFAAGCGLYFMAKFQDETWRSKVEDALALLSAEGIGGERSVGNGQFRLEVRRGFTLRQPASPNGFTSLSLVWPSKVEVQDQLLEGAQYGLVARRGWIASLDWQGTRRPNVRMLSEGSVFRRLPVGSLVDLTPSEAAGAHPIWRCGLGFPVACQLREE